MKGDLAKAIDAWQTYTKLRPHDVEGLTLLATDYTQRLATETQGTRSRQTTAKRLVGIYKRIAKLKPNEPAAQLELGQAAQDAGNARTAIDA